MFSSQEVTNQIVQLDREVVDINRNLPKLKLLQDLLDAESELSSRAKVRKLLEGRLILAKEQERQQEEDRKRQALKDEKTEAKEGFDKLTEEFDGILNPLAKSILEAIEKLDQLAWQRHSLSSRHAEIAFLLNGRQQEYGGKNELSTAWGWRVKNDGDSTGVLRALYPLYAARHKGLPGGFEDISAGLNMKGQANKAYDDMVTAARQQELNTPDDRLNDALEYLDTKRE
jgi:hypothetical protein